MSLEKELARRRFQASAEGIQKRHRRAQEAARRLQQNMAPHAGPSCAHPSFQAQLAAAARKAKAILDEPSQRPDIHFVLDRLRAEGKLPPLEPTEDVGYEPTPEEVLGDLALATPVSAPELVQDSPSAEQVLSSEPVMFEQLAPSLQSAIKGAAERMQAPPIAPSGRAGKNKNRRNRR